MSAMRAVDAESGERLHIRRACLLQSMFLLESPQRLLGLLSELTIQGPHLESRVLQRLLDLTDLGFTRIFVYVVTPVLIGVFIDRRVLGLVWLGRLRLGPLRIVLWWLRLGLRLLRMVLWWLWLGLGLLRLFLGQRGLRLLRLGLLHVVLWRRGLGLLRLFLGLLGLRLSIGVQI